MKKQILANLGSNYLLSFFGMALGFVLVPFLIGKIGKDAYGMTVLAESTVAFFEVLTISVRVALSRHATFALSRGEQKEFVEYLSTGRVILYLSAGVVLLLGTVVSMNFTSIFQTPQRLVVDSKLLFFLVCLGFTISIPNVVFWSALYARQRFDLINFATSFGLVTRAVCILVFYSFAPKEWQTLTAYGVIYLAMMMIQNYVTYYWHKRLMTPGTAIHFRHFKKERVREILSFSVHTSMTRASSLLYQETAQIIINVLWGPVYNTIYSIAIKFPNMMRRIFVEPSWALVPTFTALTARGEHRSVEKLLNTYSKALSMATLPFCFVLILYSGPLVRWWVGPEFEMAGRLLPFFSMSLFSGIPFSLTGAIFNSHGKVKIPSFVSMGAAILNVCLALLLGYVMDLKLFGIAYAVLLSSTLFSMVFLPVYCCRVAKLPLGPYWRESFVKPFSLAFAFMVGSFFAFGLSRFTDFLDMQLLLTLAGVTTAYYLTAYLVLLNTDEKKIVHDLLRPLFRSR